MIVDPHRDYESLGNVAHLAGPVAHDQETAGEVLAWVAGELARRKAANERNGKRLIVAIDEAPAVVADGRALAIAIELAREARKYRINLLVGSSETKESRPLAVTTFRLYRDQLLALQREALERRAAGELARMDASAVLRDILDKHFSR